MSFGEIAFFIFIKKVLFENARFIFYKYGLIFKMLKKNKLEKQSRLSVKQGDR
jgi:hypothetical protein